MPHKFKVGDIVTIKPSVSRNVPGGVYEVIKVLPDPDGEREYRIKSANEPHERVARESELCRLLTCGDQSGRTSPIRPCARRENSAASRPELMVSRTNSRSVGREKSVFHQKEHGNFIFGECDSGSS